MGNGLVEREVRYSARNGLHTASWRHKVTGREFLKINPVESPWGPQTPWGHEFSFRVDDARFLGAGPGPTAAFELVSAETRALSPAGKQLEVKLKAKEKPLEVAVYYAVYDGHPVVRKWIAITNQGGAPVTLSHLCFEELNLLSGRPDELQVSGYYGVHPREIFFTGRAEDTAVLQRHARTGEGLMVMNEAPGWMKRTEMAGWGNGVMVRYDTDLFPFERRLEPGETFTSAKSSIAFFVEGRGFADPRWVMPSYTSQVLMKKGAAYQPPWVYNTWEPFYRGIDDSTTREVLPPAARMGLDIFTIDDGWIDHYGDNDVDAKKFPQGLEGVRDAVERAGMRLGMWEPLAMVHAQSSAYREHPEWACRDMNGQIKVSFGPEGLRPVMCLASPYREVAARRINELISRYHLQYVKIDLTTVFNTYGEAPGCSAQGHDHKNWAESLGRTYEGIQYVTDCIYREHPDVLLDLTFELWGQKHVIDYGLLAAGDLDWLSNVNDATPESGGPRQARTLLYHRALAIPVETMLIGNLRANVPPIEEHFATVIGSAPVFLGDLRKLAPAELDWYAEKIRWFKSLRRAVAINEGFFPLGAWYQPGSAAWDGFARLSRQGEGLMALFKNESGLESIEVKLPVFPEGRFHIRSVMTGKALGTFSGAQFQRGIPVELPKEYKVEILEIRK